MSTHHRQKRGRRRGPGQRPPDLVAALAGQPGQPLPSPRVSMSFSAQQGHPFAPGAFRPGSHTRQESSFQPHAFPLPGMYPWSTTPVPSTPVRPSPLGASAPTNASASTVQPGPSQLPSQVTPYFPRGTVHQRSPPTQIQELPTKRQRHRQLENGIGLGRPSRLSIAVTANEAAKIARSVTAPTGSAVPVRQPFGPSNPPSNGSAPFANGARSSWNLDPSTRATLGHFPHSSLSLPLSGTPLPRHIARQSVSSPRAAFFGPRKQQLPHLSRPGHERTPTIPHRVGPPPKAILGGPGGKTFEELRVPSTSTSRLSTSSPSPTAEPAEALRPLSPVLPNGDSGSPPKPTLTEPFEVKVGGATVRVALPPDVYDPPDTPLEDLREEPNESESGSDVTQKDKESESGSVSDSALAADTDSKTTAESVLDQATSSDTLTEDVNDEPETEDAGDKAVGPPKAPRKEAFPWPERRVASPRSIPLPPSPFEKELELSDIENWVAHDTPHNSVDLSSSWNGKAVRVTMPPESWEALKSKDTSPGSTERSVLYEDAVDEVELVLDEKRGASTHSDGREEAADLEEPGTARSPVAHIQHQPIPPTPTAQCIAGDTSEERSWSQRHAASLSLSGNPFMQRSLGGILGDNVRENRSNAPSPVGAAFPQRGELPDWYHDPTTQITSSPNQSGFDVNNFSQRGLLPEWPSSLRLNEENDDDDSNAPAAADTPEEGWGTPQSTPGKEHGNSAAKTETDISESLWPLSSETKDEADSSTASTVDDIVVSVKVSTTEETQPLNLEEELANSNANGPVTADPVELDSASPATNVRERPRPNTSFLQRQIQSIMRSDRSKTKPATPPAAPAAPAAPEKEPSLSANRSPTSPPTQEYHTGLTPKSTHDGPSEELGDGQPPEMPQTADIKDGTVDDSSRAEPDAPGSEEGNADEGEANVPPLRKLSTLNTLKTASVFVPRVVPDIDSPLEQPKAEQTHPPSVTSAAFTFGYPSKVDHQLPLAPNVTPLNPTQPLASAPSLHQSSLKPRAPVPQAGDVSSFGESAPSQAGSGGALGLFTFTHNLRATAAAFNPGSNHSIQFRPAATEVRAATTELRPAAAEFRPNGWHMKASSARQSQGPRHHPPQLDLSKADPTSKSFELGSAFFPSNEGRIEIGNGEVSLVIPPKRPIKIARPRSPAAIPTRRESASPRHSQQGQRPDSEDFRESHSDEDRESPRRRKHTAKRSSQNSYLPKAAVLPKTPASPEKIIEDINIYPSQPVKGPAGSHEPSKPSVDTHHKRPSLNPTAKPFIFGQSTVASPASTFPPHTNAFAGIADVSKARLDTWVFPASGSNSSAAKSAQKRRHSDSDGRSSSDPYDQSPAAALHGLKSEADDGIHDLEGGEWSDWPGPPRLAPLQPDRTGDSVEFPLRRDSGQAIEVIKPTSSSSSNSPLSSRSDVAIEQGLAAEILDKLEALEVQLAAVRLGSERAIEEAFERVDVVTQSSAVKALNALRENLPTSTKALESVAAVLASHSTVLKEIQEAVNDSLLSGNDSGSSQSSSVAEGDTTLVNHHNGAIQELLVSIHTGQKAMMDKISNSSSNVAITELREVKNALLAHRAKEAPTEDAKDKEIAELKQLLREERGRCELADSKCAVFKSQVETLKKRQDVTDDAWRSSLITEVSAAFAKLNIIQASETEAQQELISMREEMSRQSELLRSLQLERDSALEIAKQRHDESMLLQKEAATLHSAIFERLDSLTGASAAGIDANRVKALEDELSTAKQELRTCKEEMCDLRVQLVEARASIALEREKGLRAGGNHATEARNLDLQLKAEKARGAFLDTKVQKAEAELHEVTQNLDIWRSAALEQRLRAEQGAVHIAAMQQENFHWREFALGADRHRLEQWLNTRPFEGLDHLTRPQRNGAEPSVVSSDAPTPRVRPKAVATGTQGALGVVGIGSPAPSTAAGEMPPVPPKIVEPVAAQ